jgi:hypothetical protein
MKALWPLLVALATVPLTAGGTAPASGIERVAWLQGCWEAVSPGRTVEEHWMAPRGGSMVGMSRTVRGEKLVEYELVVIREQGSQLAYEAHPSGQPSAVFLSDSVTDIAVVFQKPTHDFPKRIGYERSGPDRLLAWIDGGPDSERPRMEFDYRRVACGP